MREIIRDAIFAAPFAVLLLVSGWDILHINGSYSVVLFAAVALSALTFSTAKGLFMPNNEEVLEGQDSIKGKALGMEVELRGPGIVSRTLGSAIVTNCLLIALAAGLYFHDGVTTEAQRRQTAAIEVQNFLYTQPEEARLAYGRRMQVPEALRRQMVP